MDEQKLLGMKKPPYAPIAPANPSAAAASLPLSASARLNAAGPGPAARFRCQFEKATGIMQNDDPLPMPAMANRTRNASRNPGKLPWLCAPGNESMTAHTPSIMMKKTHKVIFAPPILSASHPPSGRMAAPSNGPIQAYCSGRTSGYRYFRSEEHTSELQSLMRISYAVFCLQKKKKTKKH